VPVGTVAAAAVSGHKAAKATTSTNRPKRSKSTPESSD
jgi:hypothetical protein